MLKCCKHTFFAFLAYLLLLQFQRIHSIWNEDICSWLESQTIDVDIEETGILQAKNVIDQVKSTNSVTSGQCSVTLSACPNCHLLISFPYVNLPSCTTDQTCKCDYINIQEVGYMNWTNICGFITNDTFFQYESLTKQVEISFFYSKIHSDPFILTFQSLRNLYTINGGENQTGIIQSPIFPMPYPMDYSAVYFISCSEPKNRIRLTFLNFFLSKSSYIEIFDARKIHRLGVFYGEIFRPPVIVSPNNALEFSFYANGNTERGFTVEYSFINENESNYFINTSCSRPLQPYGGVIELLNSSSVGEEMFDCIWIMDSSNDSNLRMVSVVVEEYGGMDQNNKLEIRKGQTSVSPLVIRASKNELERSSKRHVIPSNKGLYVRFYGILTPNSKLVITYAAFGYSNCYSSNYFLCRNRRCIMMSLICDGFDHCGDASDETSFCFESDEGRNKVSNLVDNRLNKYPTSYLPPMVISSRVPDIPLLACSLALIIIVLTMILVMCWLCLKTKGTNSPVHNGLSSRGTLGFFITTPPEETFLESPPDSPPLYEAPPSYEEVIKIMKSLVPDNSRLEACNVDEVTDQQKNEGPSTSQSRLKRLFFSPFRNEPVQLVPSGIEVLPSRNAVCVTSPRKFSDPCPSDLDSFIRNINSQLKEDSKSTVENNTYVVKTNQNTLQSAITVGDKQSLILNPESLQPRENTENTENINLISETYSSRTWPLSLGDRKKSKRKLFCEPENNNDGDRQPKDHRLCRSPTKSVKSDQFFMNKSSGRLDVFHDEQEIATAYTNPEVIMDDCGSKTLDNKNKENDVNGKENREEE